LSACYFNNLHELDLCNGCEWAPPLAPPNPLQLSLHRDQPIGTCLRYALP
jgi:hypothetical protein